MKKKQGCVGTIIIFFVVVFGLSFLLSRCNGGKAEPEPSPANSAAENSATLDEILPEAEARVEQYVGDGWKAQRTEDGRIRVAGEVTGAAEVAYAALDGDSEAATKWTNLTDRLDVSRGLVQGYLADVGRQGWNATVVLINDKDHENILYAVGREGLLANYVADNKRQAGEQGVAIDFVYVAASGAGSRYHSAAGCPGLNGVETDQLTKSAAREAGYTPCGICYPLGDPE